MTQARLRVGANGERLAADYLMEQGFQILDRNFRTARGELDIVAYDGTAIVFVEVKTKVNSGVELNPLLSVGPRKQQQVRRMARRWLAERRDRPYAPELRCDAIGITLAPDDGRLLTLEHIRGAF